MQITKFSHQLIPKSDYCLFLPHQEHKPYIGKWNYRNLILNNISNYCQNFDIDMVLLEDYHQTSQEFKVDGFGRYARYPFQVSTELANKYKGVLFYTSDYIMKNTMPHINSLLKEFDATIPGASIAVTNLMQCENDVTKYEYFTTSNYKEVVMQIKPYISDFSQYNRFQKFYKGNGTWWCGGGMIYTNRMNNWFDYKQVLKFDGNDMLYRFYDYFINHQKYNISVERTNYNVMEFEWVVLEILKSQRNQPINQFNILKEFKTLDLTSYISLAECTYLHFSRCGSYTNIWKLRYLLMDYILKEYRSLFW